MLSRINLAKNAALAAVVLAALGTHPALAQTSDSFSVGAQYDSTHVYVAPDDFDRFVSAFVATFGGASSPKGTFTVTPTPSKTYSQIALTPAGIVSTFGFLTPIPYPFGEERCGLLVTDLDSAVAAAASDGAAVLVAPFDDPIGRDALVQWPGGVVTQFYVHFKTPQYAPLLSIPEFRLYIAPQFANAFVQSFGKFAKAKIVADVKDAPGVEIGRPDATYRRIDLTSGFGNVRVIVTDGRLPYPFGRERTGYAVSNVDDTVRKAVAAGAKLLVPAFTSEGRRAAMIEFPGGFIAEVHSTPKR
jgi:hypothetical protein